jgi:mxaD protein
MAMNNFVKFTLFGITSVLAACATTGSGNMASTLSVEERVTVNAPASVVWAKVNNFGDLGAWHPAVAKTEIVAGDNNQVNATRLLTLQDGGTIKETLTAYNEPLMAYSYVINEGVLPVSHYASTIQVKPLTASTSEVIWKGNFKRKDLSASPAKGQDDETALNTIHAVYRGGLDNIQKVIQ